jgi:phosphate transport system substrate-binding protein
MKEPSTGGSRKGPPPIIFVLLGIGALWLLSTQLPKLLGSRPSLPAIPAGASLPGGGGPGSGTGPGIGGGIGIGLGNLTQRFPRQASVPAGTTISIDGSTSMVLINQALKTSFPSTIPALSSTPPPPAPTTASRPCSGAASTWRPSRGP